MHDDRGCHRCRALEVRCGNLERQLAETNAKLSRAVRPLPGLDHGEVPSLTSREVDVLHLIAHGLSTDEIAEQLYLSRNSVKTHTRKLYRKIGVTNRTEAAVWALHRSLPDGHVPDDDGAAVSGDGARPSAAR